MSERTQQLSIEAAELGIRASGHRDRANLALAISDGTRANIRLQYLDATGDPDLMIDGFNMGLSLTSPDEYVIVFNIIAEIDAQQVEEGDD